MIYLALIILTAIVAYLFIPRKPAEVGPFNYENIAKYVSCLSERGLITSDVVLYIYKRRHLNEIQIRQGQSKEHSDFLEIRLRSGTIKREKLSKIDSFLKDSDYYYKTYFTRKKKQLKEVRIFILKSQKFENVFLEMITLIGKELYGENNGNLYIFSSDLYLPNFGFKDDEVVKQDVFYRAGNYFGKVIASIIRYFK